jgi:hypothetical protein
VGFNKVDYSLLRLIITIICAKELDRVSLDGELSDPMQCQSDLVSHRKSQKLSWIEAITSAASDLVAEIPPVSIDDVIKLACQINSNSHGIHDTNNSIVGIGMYPLVALMNHSCIPNALFLSSDYGKFTVRLLCDVAKGQEICVSYVDLWVSNQVLIFRLHVQRDRRSFWTPSTLSVLVSVAPTLKLTVTIFSMEYFVPIV